MIIHHARSVVFSALGLVALVVLAPAPVRADGVQVSGQLGVSRAHDPAVIGAEYWTVWIAGAQGNLLSRYETTSGISVWADHGFGAPGVGAASTGVTATGWLSGGNVYERAFYVASNGLTMYMRSLTNRGGGTWTAIPRPVESGVPKSLTGRIAATWSLSGGAIMLWCFATTTDGGLWVFFSNFSDPLQTGWTKIDSGISTTAPIAASRSPTGSYGRVFAPKADGTVWMERYNGASWTGSSLGKPSSVSVCGTAAAAEDQVDAGNYRIALFCTKAGVTNATLYYATANTPGAAGGNFAWGSRVLPSGSAANIGYAIAAQSRPDGASNRAIDCYILNQSVDPTGLFQTEIVSGALTPSALRDLGPDGETYQRRGGLAATPTSSGYSLAYFVSTELNAGSARLLRRRGDPDLPTAPWEWSNHGSNTTRALVSDTTRPHTESSTASMNGRAITAAIVRQSYADNAFIDTMWSVSDGDSWDDPSPFAMWDEDSEYESDPTSDFTDTNIAYTMVLDIDWATTCWEEDYARKVVFYRTTTDGLVWSAATRIDASGSFGLDHPWLAIDRLPGAPDRIHYVWAEDDAYGSKVVNYRNQVEGAALGPIQTLVSSGGGPPVVTVGAGNVVWVVWQPGIGNPKFCRLDPGYTQCLGTPPALPDALFDQNNVYIPGTGPGPATDRIRQPGWSARASIGDGNRLYFAYQASEGNGDGPDEDPNGIHEEKDVFLRFVTFNPGDNSYTFSARAPLTVTNDNADQYQPAVTLAYDGLSGLIWDKVYVSWYDARDSAPTCLLNRCYRPMRSRSFDGGVTFVFTQYLPVDAANSLSDPALLPRHCKASLQYVRFIGDYRESRGELLHSRHVAVGAPVGSAERTATLSSGWVSGGFWYW